MDLAEAVMRENRDALRKLAGQRLGRQGEKYRVVLDLAAGRLSEPLFAAWVRAHLQGAAS